MSYGAGSSSHPGTPQSREPAKLTVPPEISVLPESNSQTTSWSSRPRPSASGSNTQISGSVISSSSVTSGFKRRSHSPNDSEDPGPSKRHRTTQYSRSQVDAPSATSSGSTGLAREHNQIIARQVPTTTIGSQISGNSAELAVANKHIHTLDDSSSNPTNVSSQHAQENRAMERPNVHATGLFPGASNFAIHNPTMVEQNIYTQSDKPPECLKWLEEYIMKGAELDSFERDPPPRCHPDTRTTLIQQAEDWFTQPPEGKRLLWLRGPAGVGKSAIIQTLAEGWREERKLGASLFFSRERRHTDPRQVFPSLAYQIATRDASYAAYISEVMIQDPRSLAKAMNEQFRVLFIEPFSRRRIREGSETWVITIDGLDECGDDQQTGRHSTNIHREIVQLVSNFAAQNPSVSFLWIIASRPEAHLNAVFDEEAIRNCFFDVEVPIDSDEAQWDVEKYLVSEFKKIREHYHDLIHETAWPLHRQFVKIVKASRGFFAFAAVLVRFIEDPNVAHPIDQLKWVMRAITRILLSRKQLTNPLVVLDELYTEILEGIKPGIFQVTRQILGASMFLDQENMCRNNWCLCLICNSLRITRVAAMTSLRPLYSVIKLAPKHPGDTRPDFYHTSFRDFLQDPLRSRAYSIDPGLVGGDIVQRMVTWLFENALLPEAIPKLDNFIYWWQGHRFHGDLRREIARYIVRSAQDCPPLGISIKVKSTECLLSYDYFQQYLENLSPWATTPATCEEWKTIDKMTSDELLKRGFLTRTTFAELSRNFKEGFLDEEPTHVVCRFDSYCGSNKRGMDLLSRCNEHPHPVPVTVIGKKKGSRYGLIKADDLAQIWISKDGSSKPCLIDYF
ncbi:hypothetical protein AN958_00570 [Leucoagaricus sp. SymC.cos]|nr:hypothetical protein AN958_00570 [Leucoagaricus sp. SymC.cos]